MSGKNELDDHVGLTGASQQWTAGRDVADSNVVINNVAKLEEKYSGMDRVTLESEYMRIYSDDDLALKMQKDLLAIYNVLDKEKKLEIVDVKRLREIK